MSAQMKFNSRTDAEEYIVNNPHRCRTTQVMQVERPVGALLYYVAVYDCRTQPVFIKQFSHYLRGGN